MDETGEHHIKLSKLKSKGKKSRFPSYMEVKLIIYMYIYIQREREREKGKETEKEKEHHLLVSLCEGRTGKGRGKENVKE
jgi:hypothetical protein